MRIHRFIYSTLAVSLLSLPLIAAAQKFQEPTKEELQMTADPKAPGAPAVYLYREESTDNRSHYVSHYARIKVLTELGKEFATVEVPYVAGFTATPIIEGRTIHADGTVIPLAGKAEDLLVTKTNTNNVKVAVFNLPSVEVGSILEYKWTMQFNEMLRRLLPQGITGNASTFQGLDTSAGFLSTAVKVSGQLGSATGKRLLLPGFFFSMGTRPEFVSEEKRTAAIDLHFADQVIDDVVYHLPAGYTVESAPQPAQLPWPDHAQLVIKTTPAAGTIDIKHIYARAFVLLDAKEYPALRDYYQKLATTDQQQVVLAAGAGGGN